ncbi:taperin [Cynoglossus semilaevis]|nr:taperin [Cynoglossus semilaevis]
MSTSAPTPSTPTLTQSQPAQTAPAVVESVKKKYPKVEEIEVIGGYQNLEKSCLVKNKGTTKKVKVCFDEEQLEQVCEYPSETSMLAVTMASHDVGRQRTQQAEEAQQEKANKDGGGSMSKNTRSVGTTTGCGVTVGQCHPLLKKNKV